MMKRFLVALFVFVMMFGSINAFSEEQAEPEYNTSISGDIVLNFNDDWQPGFIIDTDNLLMNDAESILPKESSTGINFQVYANVHIKGNTDAKILRIQSADVNTSMEEIKIDSNGNFDQEVKLVLASFNSFDSNTINFGAYVNAIKGDRTVKVKIGKGELKTKSLDISKELDRDNDGSINSLDFAAFRKSYLDYLQEEFSKMDKPESLKTYIYNEWYMKDFVMGKDGFSFNSQNHLKAITDAAKITLDINNNGKNEKFEYLTGEIDEIKEVSGVIPAYKSSDVAAYACIKAFKGNREMELGSTLRERKSGDAVVGDLNYDKSVNAVDFAILRKYLMGMIDRFPVQSGFYCADVNDDKEINSVDFAHLRMYLLGMIDRLPKDSSNVIEPTPTNSTPTPTPVTPTPTTITPTPTPVTPTPSGNDSDITYIIDNINIGKDSSYSGVEIYVDKSHKTKISISADSRSSGLNYADKWDKTYFRLSGNALNGVDFEKVDFNYFWRRVGNPDYDIDLGDSNPKNEFFITPIDAASDDTKDLEIYFGDSTECAATIHFVKGLSNVEDQNIAKQSPKPINDLANLYKPDSIITASCYEYDRVTFYTQNVLAEKSGDPKNFPDYYEPKEVFFFEENNPKHLNIIKNPPICNFPVTITNTIKGLKPETKYYYYGSESYDIRANWFKTMRDYNIPLPTTPTPSIPVSPTPTSGTGMVTYYEVNNIDTDKFPGVEIFVEKSPLSKVWISARTICKGPLYADGWAPTHFTLSGNAVNGVDYEKIDFDHFWREIGTGFNMTLEDNNPRKGFYITPIDTGSDETKDLEIYFGDSKPAATIHFVKSISMIEDKDRAKQTETISNYQNSYIGGTRTLLYDVKENKVRFRSQNFIAEKRGNPTSYPTYYQPSDIFYMEKNVPSSLKVIKNPPICNLPLVIYTNATGLKPNTTYIYGNELYSLTGNDYSASQKSFTTLKENSNEIGGSITHYEVGGVGVSPGSCREITVEKSPENKIWISARSECFGTLVADGWMKTEFKLSGSVINGVDYEKIDFDYFWRILGSDLYISPGDSNPQKGFYITPIDTHSDEPKDLEIYFESTDKPAAIIHFVEKNN